jgi:hypothetical protein
VADEPKTLEEDPPVPGRGETPFDSIEGAHEYVGLLAEAIAEAEGAIQEDIAEARDQGAVRRAQALHIVAFKLEKLRTHIGSSHRILNDLRTLRRLLLEERQERDGR